MKIPVLLIFILSFEPNLPSDYKIPLIFYNINKTGFNSQSSEASVNEFYKFIRTCRLKVKANVNIFSVLCVCSQRGAA